MSLSVQLGIEHDAFRGPAGPGGYEWWYFDAIDPRSGLSLVLIFFVGIPFSGARQRSWHRARDTGAVDDAFDFPAIGFSLYDAAGTRAYMVNLHPPTSFRAQRTPLQCSVARSSARFEDGSWHITIDDTLLDTRGVRGDLRFTPLSLPVPSSEADSEHVWIASTPHAAVEGEIMIGDERVGLEGYGYHDHNIGNTPLQRQFRRWEWGRAVDDDATFVYYRTIGLDGNELTQAFRFSRAGTTRWEAGWSEGKSRRTIYGLRHASEISLTLDSETVRYVPHRIVDNGPFYIRVRGEFVMEDGRRVPGFSEVLEPAALDWRWFHTLLDTRVRPAGSGDVIGRRITQWLVDRGL